MKNNWIEKLSESENDKQPVIFYDDDKKIGTVEVSESEGIIINFTKKQ